MRRLAVVGAMVTGLLLAGCTGPGSGQGEGFDDGWSMIVSEDFASSRAHYQSMLADDPNNPYVNLNLGVSFEETGDNEMAAKHYQVAVANGKESLIQEVAQDGNIAPRETTVAKIAQENLKEARDAAKLDFDSRVSTALVLPAVHALALKFVFEQSKKQVDELSHEQKEKLRAILGEDTEKEESTEGE